MMIEKIEILNKLIEEQREPIWHSLSELYLDTKLESDDLYAIAFTFVNSPYTLTQIRLIESYEVAPILLPNLMSLAGEWAGFDREWLKEQIIAQKYKSSDWKKIEKHYYQLKSKTN
jgi:hypothetical protein